MDDSATQTSERPQASERARATSASRAAPASTSTFAPGPGPGPAAPSTATAPVSAPATTLARRRAELVGVLAETLLEALLATHRAARARPRAHRAEGGTHG